MVSQLKSVTSSSHRNRHPGKRGGSLDTKIANSQKLVSKEPPPFSNLKDSAVPSFFPKAAIC